MNEGRKNKEKRKNICKNKLTRNQKNVRRYEFENILQNMGNFQGKVTLNRNIRTANE